MKGSSIFFFSADFRNPTARGRNQDRRSPEFARRADSIVTKMEDSGYRTNKTRYQAVGREIRPVAIGDDFLQDTSFPRI